MVGLGLVLWVLIVFIKISKELPNPQQFVVRQINQSTKIYDKTGKVLLYEIHGEEKRTVIPFDEIPEYVKQATLAAEDQGFYQHSAFDWRAVIRAMIVNIIRGKLVQGGSTITQQLSKITFLTPEKTFSRKIKELILSYWIEKHYSKDEILNLYLNQISYGANAYGIQAAAQTYFSKSAKKDNNCFFMVSFKFKDIFLTASPSRTPLKSNRSWNSDVEIFLTVKPFPGLYSMRRSV